MIVNYHSYSKFDVEILAVLRYESKIKWQKVNRIIS